MIHAAPQDPQQSQRYTVGDTFTVVHRVPVPIGTVLQPREPEDSSLVTLLGPPTVTREGDSVRVAYALAVWAPGRNELVIPGAIVLGTDGRIDTLPDARIMLDVASVLPPGKDAATVAPRDARSWVPGGTTTWLPFAVLLPVALALVAALWWLRLRRGPTVPAPAPLAAPSVDAGRLRRWRDAGEARLVLDHLEHALATVPDAAGWRERVDAVRFAPVGVEVLAALCEEGLVLVESAR